MADAPAFNPNAPYSVVPPAAQPQAAAPTFNPSQPYSVIPPQPQQGNVPVIDVGGTQGAPVGQPGSQFAPSAVIAGGSADSAPAASIPAGAVPPQQSTPPGAPMIAAPPQGNPQQPPSSIAGSPAPPPPPPQGGALQGASDAAFATLDQIPGVNQVGAATDAALGYMVGQGSQAPTFGQRYQENLKANAARLQSIPAALRVPAGIVGAVPAMALGGAGIGAAADMAAEAVPAVAPAVNALSNLPSVARYAGIGAAQGAAQGASDAPTNADIVPNALEGAGIGAATGAAIPAIGNAVGSMGRAAAEYASPFTGRTNALTDAQGNVVLGQNGAPIMATPNQARMAGQQLTQAATDPTAVREALAGGVNEIIPESTPTTFQQVGDEGLGALERAKATQNPDLWARVRVKQNTARQSVVTGLRGDGDPMAVVNNVRARRMAIDQTAQQINDITAQARNARTGAIGLEYDPEAAGAAMRDPILANEAAARAHEGMLHEAVDPEGTLGMDATPIRKEAKAILSEQTASAAPLGANESHILDAAAGYKPLMPYREVAQLSQHVNSSLRQELRTNGRTPTYARLSRFKAALEGAMDGTIGRQAEREAQAVANGTMSPEDTMAARLSIERDNWIAAQRGREADSGNGSASGAGWPTPGGMGAVPGGRDSQGEGSWGPGNAGRNTGLAPEQATLTDNWDPAAQQRRLAANAATKERARTFNSGSVGKITQKGEASDLLRVSDAQVPDTILRPGPAGLDALRAYHAAGGSPDAARDALAMKVRQIAVKPDGSLDTGKLNSFRKGYARVLSDPSMSALNDALSSAERAEGVVADAAAKVRDTQNAEAASAAARFVGAASPGDVTRQVGAMFGNRNSVALFRQLKQQIGGDAQAQAGIRRAIVQHIESKFVGNTEVGASDQAGMKADQFQTFMRQNHEALGEFFNENEVRTMGLLGLDLRRAARSVSAVKIPGGSNTAQDTEAVGKFTLASRLGRSMLGQIAEPGILGILGGEGGGLAGAAAGVAVAALRRTVSSIRNAGLKTVDDLVTEAMLHPEVARVLMAKVTPETEPRVASALSHAITRAAAVSFSMQAAKQ